MNEKIISNLNFAQKEATTHIDGPLLVLSGAGTGKTRVITSRIAHMILDNGINPDAIMAVTFTNKAANEMKTRIEKIVGHTAGLWVGTFHSISAKLLRMYASSIGIDPKFAIIDDSDKNKIIKQIIAELQIDEKRYPQKLISYLLSTIKEKCVDENDLDRLQGFKYGNLKVPELYVAYQTKLKIYNMVDFDDLIMLVVKMFKNHKNILNDLQDRFKYIMVDEYQDTSHAQHLMLKILASKYYNICCVGDEDQSIYSWRGAIVDNILNFEKDYSGAKIIKLEENYRSSSNILGIATGLITNNKSRYNKRLFSNANQGEKVRIIKTQDSNHEGNQISDNIANEFESGCKYNQMAILVRASFQIRSLEECLIKRNIPYRVVDGVKFYDRKEVKDLIAYMRFIFSDTDRLAFERIINLPKRGIGDKTLEKVFQASESHGWSITKALNQMLQNGDFSKKVADEITIFLDHLSHWREYVYNERFTLSSLADMVAMQSGYLSFLKQESEEDGGTDRIENVKELIDALSGFHAMEEFMEHIALFSAKDGGSGQQDAVNILTIHGSKGLEYDIVFLPGWEENVFPSYKSIEDNGESGLEEERRLAYVAITRARKKLFISHADSRFIFGKYQSYLRSRFIDEIINGKSNADFYDYIKDTHQPKTQVAYYKNITSNNHGRKIEASIGKPISDSSQQSKGFKIGDRVAHDRFGNGTVVGFIASHVDVRFDDQVKRLMQKEYIRLVLNDS